MKRFSMLLAGIGATGLLFAIVAFVLQVYSARKIVIGGFDFWFSCVNAALGLLFLLLSLLANTETLLVRLRSGGTRRAGKYGGNAALQALLAVLIMSGLAFMTTRYPVRWDWTEGGTHSLSPQTTQVLEGLEQDVKVVAIYQSALSKQPRKFLERYELLAGGRMEVEFIDPNAQPGRLRELDIESELGRGLLHVTVEEESIEVAELSEEALTNALLKLTRADRKRVAFVEGHGERSVTGKAGGETKGFGRAAQALDNENYEVMRLVLVSFEDVPEEVDVVIIAGPTRDYNDIEYQVLARYIERGGALLVMLDAQEDSNIMQQFSELGVTIGQDLVVDRFQALVGQPTSPLAAEYGDHPITNVLREVTMFRTARSIDAEAESGLTPLVFTGRNAWAERNLVRLARDGEAEPNPGEDLVGRVPLGVAGEVPQEDGAVTRLVVFGDSDFASNRLFREFRNRDLFINAVNWLLGDVGSITIRPGTPRASRLQLSEDQFKTVRILALFAVPEALAVLGVVVWWRRRHAPERRR